jgi:predicted ATPase
MKPASTPPNVPRRYPLYVVSGAWGSGKTSLLNALLALRPAGERWAILLNEEGRTQVNVSSATESTVTVRDAAGACACCTGQVVFVTALAALIRQTRPDRVFLEASSQASLESLLETLRTTFKDSIDVARVIQLSNHSPSVTSGAQAPPPVFTIVGWPDQQLLRALLEDGLRKSTSHDVASSTPQSLP